MKRSSANLLGSFLLLTACSTSLYHKDTASFLQMDQDLTACQVKALKDAPVANQLRLTPVRFEPVETCNAEGVCTTQLLRTGGTPYEVDVNEDLRQKLETNCMADNGYRQVDLPNCQTSQTTVDAQAPMGRITTNSCVAHGAKGLWQIKAE